MDRYRLTPGQSVKLSNHDPDDNSAFKEEKDQGLAKLEELRVEIRSMLATLRAQKKHKLLIVLQGMDASGKDGTVRHVFYGANHFGIRVASFERPTPEELAHDYLWRVHKEVPRDGEVVVFNRSHYEDVLAVRVRGLKPEDVWKRRFKQINHFERMLVEEGTIIIKFFLQISLDEQRNRLQQRLDMPHKHWKFAASDLDDRRLWPEYTEAYEDTLTKTNRKWAPWYVVPANRKWYRNIVVATIIRDTLKDLDLKFPPAHFDPKDYKIE